MKKIIIIAVLTLSSLYCNAKHIPDTNRQLIYHIFPLAESYIDSFLASRIGTDSPFAVIEPYFFNGKPKFLTYKISIGYYPYKNSMQTMMKVIKKTNRFLKIKSRYLPVIIQNFDQVFLMEFTEKRIVGIEKFPQFEENQGWRFVIDFENKRFKIEDFIGW